MMIYDWSRNQAQKNGQQTAITLEDERITYQTLETESNQLAGTLINIGLKPGDRVGLLMEKKPATIIAILGISKAGGVYIPLDGHSPPERLAKIISASDLSLLFVDSDNFQSYQSLMQQEAVISSVPWIWWSADSPLKSAGEVPQFCYKDVKKHENVPHQIIRNSKAPAYILFTSGTTGQPKGVVISHRNIITFINWAVAYFQMKAGENTTCHSPLHFDLSTFDIYGAFAAGANLHLVPSDISVNPKKLSAFIMDNEIDQWFSVPSALSYLARFKAIPDGGYPKLKRLLWCGEVFPLPALQYWMESLPGVQFTNLYGPTETTIASSYYTVPEIPADDEEVPIGSPCEGEKLLVLNDQMQEVPAEETGDLYIAGQGLSQGYWRDSEKTREAFSRFVNRNGKRERIYKTGDLASVGKDGLIYFHGRADYQIKSRGYRIELGEIESALGESDDLLEYAVVPVQKQGFEGTTIGCAYVGKEKLNGKLAPAIKKRLREKIPSYMIPQYWMEFDKLPRNGNGKIDRKKLSMQFEK